MQIPAKPRVYQLTAGDSKNTGEPPPLCINLLNKKLSVFSILFSLMHGAFFMVEAIFIQGIPSVDWFAPVVLITTYAEIDQPNQLVDILLKADKFEQISCILLQHRKRKGTMPVWCQFIRRPLKRTVLITSSTWRKSKRGLIFRHGPSSSMA